MTARDRSAGIPCAEIEVVANYWREITAGVPVAEVECAAVKVRANNRRVEAPANGIAEIIGAGVEVIAEGQVNAIVTNAGINSAGIAIGRTQASEHAYSVITRIEGAELVVVTYDRIIQAYSSSATVSSAGIAIIT